MSRTNSDELFHLIHALTKAEKRYFKLYYQLGNFRTDSGSLKLFNAIEQQKVHDEKKIFRKLKLTHAHRAANQKKFLYDLVLESLRWYHSGKSVDALLHAHLAKIEILYDKRLLQQCMKLVKKARDQAIRYNKHVQLMQILAWEETLHVENISSSKTEVAVDQLFEEHLELSDKVKKTVGYRMLLNETVKLFRKGGVLRTEEGKVTLASIMQHELMKEAGEEKEYFERYYYHNITGMYHMLMSDWEKSYDSRKKLLLLMEAHPAEIESAPRQYLSALNNLLISCEYTNNDKELGRCFEKIKNLLENPDYRNKAGLMIRLLGCFSSVLHYYIHRGEFAKAVSLFEELLPIFNKLEQKINKTSLMSFFYTFAYSYFGSGDFKKALYWLNRILNEPASELRDDIQVFARLFSLIVHVELGNEMQLEYFVKSTYRFLYRKNRLYKMETIVLEFIRNTLPGVRSPEELLTAFSALKTKLETLALDPGERKTLDYFDFISWLKSKADKKAFAAVVREKTKRKEIT